MDLNITEKLNNDEINELRKRVYSFAEQMFFSGLSTGRELNREPLQEKTEIYIKDRLSYMTSYLIRDDVWKVMPAQGYNDDPNICVPEFEPLSSEFKGDVDKMKDMATDIYAAVNNTSDQNKPDWAINATKPDWINEKKPFK